MQRGYPFIHKTKRYKPEKLSGMPKTRRQYEPLTPRTDFPTLLLPNPPTSHSYQSHQIPLSPTRSRLPKYPILSGVAQECSPHARPVPTPSYGIPCSLLGQRPGAFNCPLSVVMEENFFQYVPCPVYPERPCSDRIQRPFLLPFKLQYIAIKYFSWIFAFSPLRNANSGVAEKGACPDGGERPM